MHLQIFIRACSVAFLRSYIRVVLHKNPHAPCETLVQQWSRKVVFSFSLNEKVTEPQSDAPLLTVDSGASFERNLTTGVAARKWYNDPSAWRLQTQGRFI